jgi:hypothetical protein
MHETKAWSGQCFFQKNCSGVGVIEGNKIDWWKFKFLLKIIGGT